MNINRKGEWLLIKTCKDCGENKPFTEYYGQEKVKANGEKYIYYPPYCIECTKKRASKWTNEHKDNFKHFQKEWYQQNRERLLEKQKVIDEKNKEINRVNQSIWRKENKDKIRKYQIERNMHKSHEISDEELNELYEYANASCMYCGITEQESLKIFNQRLHRDHANNNGSDGIDNCVLACKSCNTSKRTKDWDEWYTPSNPKYTYDRYIMIEQWLNKFTI